MDRNIEKITRDLVSEIESSIDRKFNLLEENIDNKLTSLKEDFSKYEDNYRPTHKNKIDINSYIKARLGESYDTEEVKKVQDRVLLMLECDKWQDVPYKELTSQLGMAIIDDSIMSVVKFRKVKQVSLFDSPEKKELEDNFEEEQEYTALA